MLSGAREMWLKKQHLNHILRNFQGGGGGAERLAVRPGLASGQGSQLLAGRPQFASCGRLLGRTEI